MAFGKGANVCGISGFLRNRLRKMAPKKPLPTFKIVLRFNFRIKSGQIPLFEFGGGDFELSFECGRKISRR